MITNTKKKDKALKKRYQRINNDLFDNDMVRNILKNMTPEQVQEYKEIGRHLYGNIDFEKSEVLANLPPPMMEALAYVKEGIKSGLLPQDLEKDEIVLLKEAYGKEWFKMFGFTENDMIGVIQTDDVEEKVDDKNVVDIDLNKKEKDEKILDGPKGAEEFNGLF